MARRARKPRRQRLSRAERLRRSARSALRQDHHPTGQPRAAALRTVPDWRDIWLQERSSQPVHEHAGRRPCTRTTTTRPRFFRWVSKTGNRIAPPTRQGTSHCPFVLPMLPRFRFRSRVNLLAISANNPRARKCFEAETLRVFDVELDKSARGERARPGHPTLPKAFRLNDRRVRMEALCFLSWKPLSGNAQNVLTEQDRALHRWRHPLRQHRSRP